MRYRDIVGTPLWELFSQAAPVTWVRQTADWWKAAFTVGTIAYWVNIYRGQWQHHPCWTLDFGVDHKDAETHGLKTTAPTGLNQPIAVMTNVKAAFDAFMQEHRPRPALLVFYDS